MPLPHRYPERARQAIFARPTDQGTLRPEFIFSVSLVTWTVLYVVGD